jgi:hypothetical protein
MFSDEERIITHVAAMQICTPGRLFPLAYRLIEWPLLDEIITTFPVVGIPLLREQLGLSYTQIGLLSSQ